MYRKLGPFITQVNPLLAFKLTPSDELYKVWQ